MQLKIKKFELILQYSNKYSNKSMLCINNPNEMYFLIENLIVSNTYVCRYTK